MSRPAGVWTCLLAMAATAAFHYGCAESVTPGSPTPVIAPAVTEASIVAICHRIEDGTFVRSDIPTATTSLHLAHGDAFPGHFVPGNYNLRFDQTCAIIAVVNATITFKDLTANGAPITTFEESGFVVKAIDGPWEAYTSYGAPPPMAILKRPASSPDVAGTLEIRSTSGLFAFASVDLYSSITPIPYSVVGQLESRDVLAMTGTVPNTFGQFATVTNPNSPQMVDVLFIKVTNPATACCANPAGPDTIVLKR